ncbi:MAG: 50S ribosomal protein L29 [Candidatus Bathyarchaeia archaeon]|nr:50S ribosomal protein L29 [Candidatus Bathyarchaeota archaeon]
MAILKVKEIRRMSREERERKLSDLRAELARLRMIVKAGGAVDKPARIREIRRAIARILTVNNEEDKGIRR